MSGDRTYEQKLGIPEDFGGIFGAWLSNHALVARVGHGKLLEGISLTPLNLLQLRKTLDALIEQGRAEGKVTAEHQRQSDLLQPVSTGKDWSGVMPRSQVDDIAGPG